MDTSADAYFPDPRPLPPGQRRQLWARLAIRLGIFLSLVLFLCLAGRPSALPVHALCPWLFWPPG